MELSSLGTGGIWELSLGLWNMNTDITKARAKDICCTSEEYVLFAHLMESSRTEDYPLKVLETQKSPLCSDK